MIQQGDLFWAYFAIPVGSVPGYRRPIVVVQSNVFNASRIRTVMVWAPSRHGGCARF